MTSEQPVLFLSYSVNIQWLMRSQGDEDIADNLTH